MKSFSFVKLLFVGFLLSLLASVSIHSLILFFDNYQAINIALLLTSLAYIGFLLANSRVKTGKVIVVLALILSLLVVSFFKVSTELVLVGCLLSILMVRVIYSSSNLAGILANIALIAVGVFVAAGVLMMTSSWFLGFWCFFMIQAFIVLREETVKGQGIKSSNHALSQKSLESPQQEFNRYKNVAYQAINQMNQSV